MGERRCAWCRELLGTTLRSDARFCGQRCRQASHRFDAGMRRRARAATPIRIGFGDPPYPGLARKYYGDEPEFAGEVDHAQLLADLQGYDCWALATSADALPYVLSLLEDSDGRTPPRPLDRQGREVRVAIWHRGDRAGSSRFPRRAWEPVVYAGGRQDVRADWTPDLLSHTSRARTTEARALVGSKPGAYWWWLFELLGARPGDSFDDLFAGTGGGARAWARYASQTAVADA